MKESEMKTTSEMTKISEKKRKKSEKKKKKLEEKLKSEKKKAEEHLPKPTKVKSERKRSKESIIPSHQLQYISLRKPQKPRKQPTCCRCTPVTFTRVFEFRPLKHMKQNNPCAVCQGDKPFLQFRKVLLNVCTIRMVQYFLAFVFSFYAMGFALNHFARHYPEARVTLLRNRFRVIFFATTACEQVMYGYFTMWFGSAILEKSFKLCVWWYRTSWIAVVVATVKFFVFIFLTPEYWYVNFLYLLGTSAVHAYEVWIWQSFRTELMYGEIISLGHVDLEDRDIRLRRLGAYIEEIKIAHTKSYQDWNASYAVAENFLRVSNRFNRPKGAELWYNQPTHKELLRRLKPKRADLVPKPIIPKRPFHRPKRNKPNLKSQLGIKEHQFRMAVEKYLKQVSAVSTIEILEAGRQVYRKHGMVPPGKPSKRKAAAVPVRVVAPAKKEVLLQEQGKQYPPPVVRPDGRVEFMEPPGRRPRPPPSDDGSASPHRVTYFTSSSDPDRHRAHRELRGRPSISSSATSEQSRRGLLKKPGFTRGYQVRPTTGSSDKTVTFGKTKVQSFELSATERAIKKLAHKKLTHKKRKPIYI